MKKGEKIRKGRVMACFCNRFVKGKVFFCTIFMSNKGFFHRLKAIDNFFQFFI